MVEDAIETVQVATALNTVALSRSSSEQFGSGTSDPDIDSTTSSAPLKPTAADSLEQEPLVPHLAVNGHRALKGKKKRTPPQRKIPKAGAPNKTTALKTSVGRKRKRNFQELEAGSDHVTDPVAESAKKKKTEPPGPVRVSSRSDV